MPSATTGDQSSTTVGGREAGAGRLHYACVAGTCAALGSFFGKLTSSSARADLLASDSTLGGDGWLPTAVFVVLMVLSNAMVWTFFVRALHSAGGSLVATVTSAATNYAVSALLGCMVFGERTSLLWWSGTGLVIVGLVLIGTDETVAGGNQQATTSKRD